MTRTIRDRLTGLGLVLAAAAVMAAVSTFHGHTTEYSRFLGGLLVGVLLLAATFVAQAR